MTMSDLDASAPSEEDPEEIRAQIEQTRTDMSQTIDAIQEKLNPDNLKEQAKEMVREATVGRAEQMINDAERTARGFGSGMMETIKENPIPAMITGIGLALLFKNRANNSNGSSNYQQYRYRPSETYYDRSGGYSGANSSSGPGEMVRQATDTIGGVASGAKDQVGDIMSGARDQVGSAASGAREQLGNVASGTQEKAQEATDAFQRALRDNPMAVGAFAVALGAAVGFLVPETTPEHQIMGSARDNLLDKAQSTIQDTMGKVGKVAEEAQNAVKTEAENQGLATQA